ncbi:hypothetical protein GW17_00014214 [Ensete ventricosum]|nr:hypothetical protein GW17_00014214 [Ensete ventricosum]
MFVLINVWDLKRWYCHRHFWLYWMFYTVVIFNIIDYLMPFQYGSNVPYFMLIV